MPAGDAVSDELLPAAVLGPTCHRFLSPHYDDIALSCGGTVALLSERGLAPEIEVLFGEGPAAGAALSPFAAENLRDWGLTAVEATAVRRQEERTAAGVLGATTSWLPFPDAIYRDRHYLNNEQLFGEPVAVEGELPEGLIAGLELSEADRAVTRLYAPLAVGGHVDHRHAFRAGRALAIAGWDVWFYEDLPYALRPGLLEDRLAAIGPELVPAAVVPIGPVWETKLAAIFAYPSQLARTFSFAGSNGSRDDIARLLDGYARRIGGGERAERFWRLGGAGKHFQK